MKSKTALVTGSSKGIGREIALNLAKSGYDIVVNYLQDQAGAEQVAHEIETLGRGAQVVQADVSEEAAVSRLFNQAYDRFGSVDVLVNNAGIARDKSLIKMDSELWREVLNTNLTGAFFCSKAAIPRMIERNCGRIVNIASVIASTGAFGQTNYAASKSGLLGLTRSLALEVAKYGITVNAICPGFVQTRMLKAMPPEVLDQIIARVPLRRLGQPEDIADAVAFLVEKGSYITGTTINVNGGLYLG